MNLNNDNLADYYKNHLLWLFNINGGTQLKIIDKRIIGINFSNMYFCGAVFEKCTFENCVFENTSMSGSNFRNTTFTDCNIHNSNFNGCDFLNATFINCDLEYTSFECTSLYHTYFDKKSCYVNSCDFVYSCIDDCNITKMNTRNSFIANAYVDFSKFASSHNLKLSDCEALPQIYPFHYLEGYVNE